MLAIAVILFIALRRLRDTALVLAPLLLSAALTVLVMVLLPLPLNFANIIALPLLLGVGVSFNIYFVMNWRAGRREMLASATARAVAFSALTTGTSFGSLALSGHPGTASMGELLLISLGCTLVASLIFVPALLAAISHPRGHEWAGSWRSARIADEQVGSGRRRATARAVPRGPRKAQSVSAGTARRDMAFSVSYHCESPRRWSCRRAGQSKNC